ncbi:molybdopterin-dependent oxidoreductase [Haliangium sp.]|uniref:molybdopterin-dependent oxidoreductase n=1 Tax=Haliangium sp. TaxID=2663208 RepID=UPI003D12250B
MSTDTVYRSCTLCEAHCGVAVTVDRAQGRAIRVEGDPDDPFSQGYICPKAHGLLGLQDDPDRLRRPLKRDGERWVEIEWDEALALAADGLMRVRAQHGPEALASYAGNPSVHDLGATVYLPALLRALGTRKRFSASSVDQLPKQVSSLAMYGAGLKIPIPDLDRTDYLLILGANPVVSNGSLMTAPDVKGRLKRLRARGGKLVVIDPRRSETARAADEHHFIRPGTDALLLMSMVQVLFSDDLVALGRVEPWVRGVDELRALAQDFTPERTAAHTGIDAATVRRLAHDMAGADSAVCYGRIGTCTQTFGTVASWLVDCVTILTGNLDRPGGAMFPRPATSPAQEPPRKPGKPLPYGRWRSSQRGLPEAFGELPVAALAEEIDSGGDQRVRALLTMAGNPVLSTPNGARLARALASLDFMVSIDLYLNETTRFADVILPPTAPLEHDNYELVFTGLSVRNVAKYSPAALPPPPDSRAQWYILAELAGRLGGANADLVDEMVLSHLLERAVGPKSATPEVSLDQARAALGDRRGPLRVLDLMLRAGPYGDRFQADSDGLSLARLREHPHGLDLGPLEPRLPEFLSTPSGAVELAPEIIVADVPRLREALAGPTPVSPDDGADGADLVLIGRRLLRSNNSWMGNIHALAKGPETCTLIVHPDDATRLGLRDGARARVSSRVGELVAPVRISDEVMPGVASLPHGFGHDADGAELQVARRQPGVNTNLLTDELPVDAVSGTGVLNGIPVRVGPAA